MSKGHNKKRNVGIVYEQLVATVTRAMIDDNAETVTKSLKLLKKHFAQGTELYREFRLFNALLQTHVTSEALASRILQETKYASSQYDIRKLRSEKSDLINEINRVFDKNTFYNTPVKNYKILATIHVLMEEWRKSEADVVKRVKYESNLHEWLLVPKETVIVEELKTPNINDLTVKLMRNSFNKKFGKELNENQRELVKSLVFECDKEKIVKRMTEQKNTVLKLLSSYELKCDSKYVKSKIPQSIVMLESLDTVDTTDKNIAKFLTVAQLCDELLENKNE